MGSCTVPNPKWFGAYTKENMDFLAENDICVIDGPNWEHDRALIVESGPQSLVDNLHWLEGLKNNPVKSLVFYAQASFSDRFQEYYPGDWFASDQLPHTPLLDYGLVNKMQVAFFIGLFDSTCRLPYAMDQKRMIGES